MLKSLSRPLLRSYDNDRSITLLFGIIGGIIAFLSVFMPKRSAKKIVAMILLIFHMSVKDVVKYSGIKKSCIYTLRNDMRKLECNSDFLKFVSRQCTVKKGRGRKSPIKDIKEAIFHKNIIVQNI